MRKTCIVTISLCIISIATYSQELVGSRITIKDGWDNVLRSVDLNRGYDLIGTYRGWDTTAIYIAGYNKTNSSLSTRKVIIGNPSLGSNYLMVNLQTGNVGIGVSNPQYSLVVGGVAHFLGSDLKLSAPSADRGNPGSARALVHYTNNTLHLNFLDDFSGGTIIGANHLFVSPQGNIGVNTMTPTNKLDVNGTIRAKEVKVESGWADFVFKPDYQLKPLSEVEQFISTNGHLPEIPTEKEVAQNGVSIGEMNAKLLQKVEELTLYLIEQKKIIEKQQQQITKMNTEIQTLKDK
ncbi:hypothetical protein [uncultured Acetobacteroides sp.]|uniref:hypothetical protein n=1 Tax=uncultured Acetobacteroides sp. TaxID=1760811 RepID=UPI0029F52A3C|nr:hypothetical protein [uncultured Acetobacteroides sp.]